MDADKVPPTDQTWFASDAQPIHLWPLGDDGLADRVGLESVRTNGGHSDVDGFQVTVLRGMLEQAVKIIDMQQRRIDRIDAEVARVLRLLGDDDATR